MNEENILVMKGIVKSFPGVKALKGVDLKVKKGSVHAVMGENGAGKSTLMKVLFGLYHADSGDIEFKGKPYHVNGPIEAIHKGISIIPQEISPVPNISVAANIFLGKENLKNRIFVDKKKNESDAQVLFDDLGIKLDPATPMCELSIANAQLIAIVTAVSNNSDLIIMDEPTSALTDSEVDTLFHIIRKLKEEKGLTVIYISHKLDEIFAICEEVSVYRDGEFIGCDTVENLSKEKLISMMVGRNMDEFFHKEIIDIGDVFFKVNNLSSPRACENISFELKKGEVLGFAGLMGAGRSEVMETIFGARERTSGELFLHGEEIHINSPQDAIAHHIGFVTEDRKLTGIFPELSVEDNMIMPNVKSYLNHIGLMRAKKVNKECSKQRDSLRIKTPSIRQLIKNLSGGNQQKVLVSRWLLTEPEILILDEPTRGIDVGAKAEIHRLISELAKLGKGIIMISSEMPEILSISDRIIVMHEGKQTGVLSREEATQEKILALASQ